MRYSIRTSMKELCDTIATSIARYGKYRFWASKAATFGVAILVRSWHKSRFTWPLMLNPWRRRHWRRTTGKRWSFQRWWENPVPDVVGARRGTIRFRKARMSLKSCLQNLVLPTPPRKGPKWGKFVQSSSVENPQKWDIFIFFGGGERNLMDKRFCGHLGVSDVREPDRGPRMSLFWTYWVKQPCCQPEKMDLEQAVGGDPIRLIIITLHRFMFQNSLRLVWCNFSHQ